MITRIHIQNYRSFVDAEVKLRPFSLVIGANGSGKTNLLRAFAKTSDWHPQKSLGDAAGRGSEPKALHVNAESRLAKIEFGLASGSSQTVETLENRLGDSLWTGYLFDKFVPIFSLSAEAISNPEKIQTQPEVYFDGSGTTQVLEGLKNGDREDLFDAIESKFRLYVPEVEKLSLRTVEPGTKQIQVRERGLKEPLPASELSEGTRLILCILTIIHQEKPPPVILLEDIDRGMHPRIFEQVVPLMRDIAEKHDINIIATTHNPFLVDCFEDDPEAVIIVEKKDGASTLSTLKSHMEGLDYDKVDPDEMPLGNLWYSGLVGGVPLPGRRRNRREA